MNADTSHLDLPIAAGRREEWAAILAERPPEKPAGDRQKIFVARLGAEWFGFPPTLLLATQPDVRPRRLPHRQGSTVEGLVNADGRVIVCLALERVFGVLPQATPGDVPRLLIFQAANWTFAARVRHVLGVEEVNFDQLLPLSESTSEDLRRCARGIIVRDGVAITCLGEEAMISRLVGIVR